MDGQQNRKPRQNVSFESNGTTAYGYLSETVPGPGVVVIQEWWGLTAHIADVADRLAEEGFVALAPDLFGGATAHNVSEAARLVRELPVEQAARDLAGAVDFLLEYDSVTTSTVGVVGFCMGGGFALSLAAQQGSKIGATVPFYGIVPGEPPDFSGLHAEVQGHWAEDDPSVPPEQVEALATAIREQSGKEPEFHTYPARHAFHNDRNPRSYNATQAALAWDRTLRFLRRHLV